MKFWKSHALDHHHHESIESTHGIPHMDPSRRSVLSSSSAKLRKPSTVNTHLQHSTSPLNSASVDQVRKGHRRKYACSRVFLVLDKHVQQRNSRFVMCALFGCCGFLGMMTYIMMCQKSTSRNNASTAKSKFSEHVIPNRNHSIRGSNKQRLAFFRPKFTDTTNDVEREQRTESFDGRKQTFELNPIEVSEDYGKVPILGVVTEKKSSVGEEKEGIAYYPATDLSNVIPKEEALDVVANMMFGHFLFSNRAPTDDSKSISPSSPRLYPQPKWIRQAGLDSAVLEEPTVAVLTRRGYKGGFPEMQVNQDRVIIHSPFIVPTIQREERYEHRHDFLLGVFDGHGDKGHIIAHYASMEMPNTLMSKVEHNHSMQNTNDEAMKILFADVFEDIDRTVPALLASGCTAALVVRWGDTLYFANVGDSTALLVFYIPSNDVVSILYQTRPDKPHLDEEYTRIKSVGGNVMIPPPKLGLSSRVEVPQPDGRVLLLAMSRSIGDHEAKSVGVTHQPTVHAIHIMKELEQLRTEHNQEEIHMFVVGATDGLLDHVSPQEVAMKLAKSLFKAEEVTNEEGGVDVVMPPLEACEQLIMEASQRWLARGNPYRDDISVAVTKIVTS